MMDDAEQYDKVCKGEFDRLFKMVSSIDAFLRGSRDGKDSGVMVRLDRLERSHAALTRIVWIVVTMVVVGIATALWKAIIH